MIGYTTVGSNDIPRASAFYDALLAQFGGKRFMDFGENFICWASSPNAAVFCVCKPFNGEEAHAGNGNMIALAVENKAQVDAIHARALELGASDEGAPGPRGEGFYAGYFRDLDGNKLNVFVMGEAAN